jgi:hypothetical protein
MGLFFSNNPVEMYNRAFRGIAGAEGLSAAEQALLFVKLSMAGADALIGCWDDKAFWSFWRPVTAIHEGDNDGNRRTVGDAAWTPLLTTPPYPDHPSGYNCYTGATMNTAKDFFGNRFAFSLSAPVAGVTSHATTALHGCAKDTIDARCWAPFPHSRCPGAKLGKEVARWLDCTFQRASTGKVISSGRDRDGRGERLQAGRCPSFVAEANSDPHVCPGTAGQTDAGVPG